MDQDETMMEGSKFHQFFGHYRGGDGALAIPQNIPVQHKALKPQQKGNDISEFSRA